VRLRRWLRRVAIPDWGMNALLVVYLAVVLSVMAAMAVDQLKAEDGVPPVRLKMPTQWVCAPYEKLRRTHWSCRTAGDVSAWILENGGSEH
jgi:hypothetical protein